VLLADRGFCSSAALASLQQRGVDSVMRLPQMRRADFRAGRVLGPEDRLIVWQKPVKRPEAWSVAEFAAPLRHWVSVIAAAGGTPRQQDQLIDQMLATIARDPVPARPGRSEPRARKRRAKNYQLLTKPRHETGNLPRRNRPQQNHPKPSLS
jgi:hypothetical protein